MYVIFLYNTFKTFIDNMELLRSEYFTTEESIMDSTITTELLEKEIVRLREENKKLTNQLEFVCKNREVIQKSFAALVKAHLSCLVIYYNAAHSRHDLCDLIPGFAEQFVLQLIYFFLHSFSLMQR